MSEITYPFIREYLHAIQKEDDKIIEDIRQYALSNNVPIIKLEVKQLLEVLVTTIKPKRILEIGTAIGYSSLIMSSCLDKNGHITTIERSEEMIVKATQHIKAAGKDAIIQMLEGDAETILDTLDEPFDMIFMDAAKGQYITFLPNCLRLLKPGGLLISDNVLQEGYVAKSRWSIPRRQRTIHNRMRTYLWELNHNPQLKTAILPIADGVTISCKLKEGEHI
jgi:predicted O-methyltransferase YrrM